MFIELSYKVEEEMPVYPGLPKDKFQPHTRMAKGDPSNTTLITHFLHNGSHVDAPFHFYDAGKTIDEIPIENFVYERPFVIQKKSKKSELIQLEDLTSCGDELRAADILFLYTGYSALRNDRHAYADDFPAVSEEAARYIRTELPNLKAVAIDTLSIESATMAPQTNFKVHRTFLDGSMFDTRTLLIYEDVNIEKIINEKNIKRIYAFPLRLKGLDASPVTIVAETNE
jgi:arylformamidase